MLEETQKPKGREKQLAVRVAEADADRISARAKADGISISNLLRRAVRLYLDGTNAA